jgi:conjugal transfer pilus assembly protein TraB
VNLRAQWEALSPDVQRWMAFGVAGAVVLGIAAITVATTAPPRPAPTAQETLVRTLLTDTDPRSLGIEGLATRLERMEKHVTAVQDQLEKDKREQAAEPPERPLPASEPAAPANTGAIDDLKRQIATLQQQVDTAKQAALQAAPPPGRLRDAKPPPPVAPVMAVEVPRSERPLDQLFSPPGTAMAVPPAAAPGGGRALDIRVVTGPAQDGTGSNAPAAKDALFIPAGTILRGVLLNGLDAPTGQGARSQPTPALVRIKHAAILPNRFRADVKECFVIVGGFGDLGAERAYLRSETLTCVRTDGGVIEVPIDGYAVGEDGKVGVRGRLVSKQGAMLARAMQAGFLQSFSKVFTQVPSIPISTSGSQVQFQSMLTPQSAQAGIAGGVGGAMEKLADYYMTMAENTFPVLEVDAGRGIEIILNKGVSLRLAQ